MSRFRTYSGKFWLDSSAVLEVDLRVTGKEIVVASSSGGLGAWAVDDVGVVQIGNDRFLLDLDGEDAIFLAADATTFCLEGVPQLGVPTRYSMWRQSRRELLREIEVSSGRSEAVTELVESRRLFAPETGSSTKAGALPSRDPHRDEAALPGTDFSPERRSDRWSAKGLARSSGKALLAIADLFGPRRPGPRILSYSQIRPEDLEAQLDWIAGCGDVVSLEEALRQRGSPDSHALHVVTLDDGYANQFEVAYPLLKQRRMPFTLYLTTEHVETGVPLPGATTPLTWDRIMEMYESGLMTLGAHTHRHVDLKNASRSQVEDELGTSDTLIRERTAVTPIHFSYPWGQWSPIADTVVRRHYASATLGAGDPVTAQTEPFLVHRLPIKSGDSFAIFKRKALRGMPWRKVRVGSSAGTSAPRS